MGSSTFCFSLPTRDDFYDHLNTTNTKTSSPFYLTYTRLHAKHWAGMNSSNWHDTINPDDVQME